MPSREIPQDNVVPFEDKLVVLFGYDRFRKSGGEIVGLISSNGAAPELKKGQRVNVKGIGQTTIEGFHEPFKQGLSDHIIQVRKVNGELYWIKPSEIL